MSYTDYASVNNKYLGDTGDKAAFTSSGDAAPLIESAERIIRARLSGFIDPAYQATWLDTNTTPEIIQEIAARLTAALRYRQRSSEDVPGEPNSYAQTLYNEAMDMLTAIVDGKLDIIEVGLVLADSAQRSVLHFYPNDTVQDTDPDSIKFRIGQVF